MTEGSSLGETRSDEMDESMDPLLNAELHAIQLHHRKAG